MPSDLNSTHGIHMVEGKNKLSEVSLWLLCMNTYHISVINFLHFFHFPMALLIPKEFDSPYSAYSGFKVCHLDTFKTNPLFLHWEEGSEQKYLESLHCLFQKFKFNRIYQCVYVGGSAYGTWHMCGGQKSIFRSWFSPPPWTPGIEHDSASCYTPNSDILYQKATR